MYYSIYISTSVGVVWWCSSVLYQQWVITDAPHDSTADECIMGLAIVTHLHYSVITKPYTYNSVVGSIAI